jgi:stage V sporulation protein R
LWRVSQATGAQRARVEVPQAAPARGQAPAQPLPDPSDWTFELIERYHAAIAATAERYGLDTYPNQLEIITAEQMMDAYASVGMPVNYRHWSYGKEFLATERRYRRGHMGLAYEIVINSNPCISYLMEENTTAMQALVIAHAAYGHNSFFKGNYLFRMWTDASSIIDYLVYARDFVAQCEERHGLDTVEQCWTPATRWPTTGWTATAARQRKAWRGSAPSARSARPTPSSRSTSCGAPCRCARTRTVAQAGNERFPKEPQENILYFIEKNAPLLEPWQREIVRIVRKIAQYFYPQRQTQVMNEGWATFWHHPAQHPVRRGLPDRRRDAGVADLAHQRHLPAAGGAPRLQRHQPLCAGFCHVHRHPAHLRSTPPRKTAAGSPTSPARPGCLTLDHAMRNFKDESFVGQFLSPKLMREMRLFAIHDDEALRELEVSAIHDDSGYRRVRQPCRSSTTWARASPTSRSGT